MYYMQYLANLCHRRHWADPLYEPCPTGSGYGCVVRVNNREYQTDSIFSSQILAQENAAMRAYLICRNFSVNDGMYPIGHDHGGIIQGLPVAIGTGRRRGQKSYDLDADAAIAQDHDVVSNNSADSQSGGSSPESHEADRARFKNCRIPMTSAIQTKSSTVPSTTSSTTPAAANGASAPRRGSRYYY